MIPGSRNSALEMDLLPGPAAECHTTLLVVTHDKHLAKRGDRKLVIRDGGGKDS